MFPVISPKKKPEGVGSPTKAPKETPRRSKRIGDPSYKPVFQPEPNNKDDKQDATDDLGSKDLARGTHRTLPKLLLAFDEQGTRIPPLIEWDTVPAKVSALDIVCKQNLYSRAFFRDTFLSLTQMPTHLISSRMSIAPPDLPRHRRIGRTGRTATTRGPRSMRELHSALRRGMDGKGRQS